MKTTDAQRRALPGKYLSFRLGAEEYGLEVLEVQEIIGVSNVTRVPRTPNYLRGVINLRGKVIPVIELRLKLGMESRPDTALSCVIILQPNRNARDAIVGMIVDEVSEVLNLAEEQLGPPPAFTPDVDVTFILGMARVGARMLTILDIDHLLAEGESK